MALVEWTPDGGDFGNARGLDYVATDVYARIAEAFGATVTVGKLPADVAERQATMEPDTREHRDTFAVFTISWDGGTYTGQDRDGKGSTSGYRTHRWVERIADDTVVVDLRTVPSDRIVAFAVKGPMLNVSIPAGMMSTLREIPSGMRDVAEAYLAPYGGLAATGFDS